MAVADVLDTNSSGLWSSSSSPSKISWGKAAGAGAGIGGALAGLFGGGNALGGYSDDMGNIEDMMEKYYREGMGYLTPYSQTGTKAFGDMYSSLSGMSDPSSYYNKTMAGYNQSPLAMFQRKQGLDDVMSSAASRGLLGSTAMGRNLLDFSQGLTSKDMQNYWGNIMDTQKTYLGGLGEMSNMGLNASTGISNLLQSLGTNRAELEQAAAQARAASKASESSGWGDILGAGAGIAGKIAGFL